MTKEQNELKLAVEKMGEIINTPADQIARSNQLLRLEEMELEAQANEINALINNDKEMVKILSDFRKHIFEAVNIKKEMEIKNLLFTSDPLRSGKILKVKIDRERHDQRQALSLDGWKQFKGSDKDGVITYFKVLTIAL